MTNTESPVDRPGIETILHHGKQIALVIRSDVKINGTEFFTGTDNPFQLGLQQRPKGHIVAPHVHILNHAITVNAYQELLIVHSGLIRVTLYTKKCNPIETVTLGPGDTILLMDEGHGVEFL